VFRTSIRARSHTELERREKSKEGVVDTQGQGETSQKGCDGLRSSRRAGRGRRAASVPARVGEGREGRKRATALSRKLSTLRTPTPHPPPPNPKTPPPPGRRTVGGRGPKRGEVGGNTKGKREMEGEKPPPWTALKPARPSPRSTEKEGPRSGVNKRIPKKPSRGALREEKKKKSGPGRPHNCTYKKTKSKGPIRNRDEQGQKKILKCTSKKSWNSNREKGFRPKKRNRPGKKKKAEKEWELHWCWNKPFRCNAHHQPD